MATKNKEFSTEEQFGYKPMDSLKLNTTFGSKGLEGIDSKKEYLLSLGIHPEFVGPLNDLFNDIKATTSEILLHTPDILISNNRINSPLDLKYDTQTNLAIMKASA